MRLWQAGEARIIVNEQGKEPTARLLGLGFLVDDAAAATRRAHDIGAPTVFRRTLAHEQQLDAVETPDGTEIYWADPSMSHSWQQEFEGGMTQDSPSTALHGRIDHINIATSWQNFDEAVLFNTSVLALEPEAAADLPGPQGLVRSQVMRTEDGAARIAMNLVPPTAALPPRHVAVQVDDALAVARNARARGLRFLPIPSNYYDDLRARFGLAEQFITELHDLHLLYDRDANGAYIHFYTPTVDEVFFEIVQRVDAYDGYGASNAPVRLAAQPQYQLD